VNELALPTKWGEGLVQYFGQDMVMKRAINPDPDANQTSDVNTSIHANLSLKLLT
jgi:hypothetical protein